MVGVHTIGRPSRRMLAAPHWPCTASDGLGRRLNVVCMLAGAALPLCRRALLEEDDQPADAITTPRSDGYHAGAEAAAIERPRSPLSRIASMVDEMHTPPLHERPRSSLCEQVSCWFAATLLLGVLAVVALVAVAFPLPATTAQAAACRKSAAVAVLQTRGNATHREQQLVVWSGIGHSDYLFHDLHVFRYG